MGIAVRLRHLKELYHRSMGRLGLSIIRAYSVESIRLNVSSFASDCGLSLLSNLIRLAVVWSARGRLKLEATKSVALTMPL